MKQRIALFWPGDYRDKPNQWALPGVEEATAQLEKALVKLGYSPYLVEGFISRPHQSIEKLGPIDDPIIGVCTHWLYGPHTTDGVVGKDTPLLLASNFSGQWPGLVGLLNTSACLESVGRQFSRVWTNVPDWTADERFMSRLEEWCSTGAIAYPEDEISYQTGVSSNAETIAKTVEQGIRDRRVLALMLGDTSMGMINGYFGPRLLNPIGFTEHKVDQAWIIDRGRSISDKRIEDAYRFVRSNGVAFHYGEEGAEDFDENATREQLRDYLTVLDMIDEFKADCLGWQYQLGLLNLRPPSDFAEGLLNSVCRPESNGDTVATATEADQGNLVAMEMMKRLLKAKGLHQSVMFHRRPLGRGIRRAVHLGAAELGLLRGLRLQPRPGYAERCPLLPAAFGILSHPWRHLCRGEPARRYNLGSRLHQGWQALDGYWQRGGSEAAGTAA